jgi:Leucine-rich repeat (LRR) protein
LENLRQQDPSLRDRVLSHLSELVPPRNDGDARILSVASDAAVPHLQYADWKDERTSTVAACAQALRLIGTTAATRTLKRGYLSDNRGPVIAEVCRTGSIPYAKVPMVVSAVEETGRLPPYIDLADILLLVGLQNLKNLEVSSPLPRNIEALSHLTHLSNVHVLRIPLDEVSNFPWVPTINSFHLGGCPGNNLSWLEKFTNLQELALYSLTDVQDLASTKSLTTLRALILSHMGFRSPSPLCSLAHLEKIHLRGCPQITDLEPISALANLRQVVIDSCGGLKGINALSHLHLTELSIEDSAGISDLRPMGQMSTLVSLKLDGLRKIESIEPIKGFGELQHITLSRLPLLSELSPIGHLRTLRSLLIHDCRSVKHIPPTNALRNLEKITLSELPLVDDFAAIGETPGLASLRIQNCEQLADLDFISDVQSLRTLRIEGAARLKNIVPVHNLGSLTGLIILRCSELDNLSALSAVSNLERITLVSCRKVTDLAPLAELSKLKEITLADCQNIRNLAVLAKLPNLEKIHLGDFDVKRMQIPEALLPLVQSGGVYVSHRRAIRFKHNYYHRYHYFGRDDPIIIYRHGVETELVSVFSDEIDIELQ